MPVSPMDDFLAHQTTDTFDYVFTSDRHFYARYYSTITDTTTPGLCPESWRDPCPQVSTEPAILGHSGSFDLEAGSQLGV